MFNLSSRCKLLRENAVDKKNHENEITLIRAYYFAKGICEAGGKLADNKGYLIACGLAKVIDNFTAIIDSGELLVGHNYGADGSFVDKEKEAEILKNGYLPGVTAKEYYDCVAEKDLRIEHKECDYFENDKDRMLCDELAVVNQLITDNHTVIDYEKVLELGFEGILNQLEGKDGVFYDSMRLVCKSACELGEKYAQKAKELLNKNLDGYSADELEAIIEVCSQVPRRPAQNFHQAVQSLWFAHIINTWEDGINANSLGRLDQILYPYYQADLKAGRITKQQAFELICCLWIKLYRDYDVQQSCVGGCDFKGESAVNELSYIMLDATEALDFIRCISVRYSQNTEKEFVKRALEVVGRMQKGVPFFFNDDVMIPALVDSGISFEDASDYTQIGCVETVIPGKSNPHAVSVRCNLLKAVEYAMGSGKSMINPHLIPGVYGKGLDEIDSWQSFEKAVFTQLDHIISSGCAMMIRELPSAAENAPKPYKSVLTEGCVESGRDFNNQGAKYDYYQVMFLGIPNLADSMAAVKKLVFDEKKYTLDELYNHLSKDFPEEAVRLEFMNKAPKFGNDIDAVDDIAADILNHSCDLLKKISADTGYAFHAQPFTFIWMFEHGRHTAATPDGRRAGEILAYSVSPMQGRDFNGFTALLNSLAKLPSKKAAGTTSAIVEVDPLLFNDSNIPHFVEIMFAAGQKGLCNIQFNVVDAKTLRDAQKNPGLYRNLAVRVSGFSQKFELLDKDMQDHIIERTKHRNI